MADGGRWRNVLCRRDSRARKPWRSAADGYFMIEPRAYYTGQGEVRIKSIRLVERTP